MMNQRNYAWGISLLMPFFVMVLGCQSPRSGNVGNMQTFSAPTAEALWIRQGEPISFEGDLWAPADGIEGLQDNEMYLLGKYREVFYFVEKVDVRPYNRLYTKFGRNQFRYFEKIKK